MKASRTDLDDLLTGVGLAVGAANQRLAVTNTPSLLREFTLELKFRACVRPACGERGVRFGGISGLQETGPVLAAGLAPNIRLAATYIAAPSLQVAPGSGAVGPHGARPGVDRP